MHFLEDKMELVKRNRPGLYPVFPYGKHIKHPAWSNGILHLYRAMV